MYDRQLLARLSGSRSPYGMQHGSERRLLGRLLGPATLNKVNLQDTGMWKPVHDAAWDATVLLLRNAISLAYPKPATHALAVFSDASDTGWGTLLAQYPREQHGLPITERDLEPLSVQSGTFGGSAANWSTWSKEGYALVMAVTSNRT